MTELTPSATLDEMCILDPGGEGRADVPVTDAEHSPGDDPDGLDRMLEPVSAALFAAAALRNGDAVVDVGCGAGATTLRAAESVGRSGFVCGIDVTEAMLAVARRRLTSSGLTNVELVEGDAETHEWPQTFDVAISRFGTMFFPDPVRTFAHLGAGLRDGGRLCFASWQPLEANDWLLIPGVALLPWITLPDFSGGGPGMFAQSDPDAVALLLGQAGYTDVVIDPLTITLPLGEDPDEALDRLADTGVGRAVLGAVSDGDRPAATAAVRDALAACADADGVRLRAGVLLVSARRP